MNDTAREKQLLLAICGMTILALSAIATVVVFHGITAESGTLLGMIATGMLAIAKDIIQAIRGYSMSAQLGKVTDQLAASGPVATDPSPQTAIDAAEQVAGAAADQAATIKDS